MSTFAEMNQAYMEVSGSGPPARITVVSIELALGAAVEIGLMAY
jgi:enamine deaminase RidA (YjgF/YER057c/UK114 family)